ncbi:MAG: DNA-binding protein [Pseudomonadota bacterium]
MGKDLTDSSVERQNILNNPYALQEIEKATRIKGIPFEGKTVVLKEQVAAFFEVTLRTIENYLGKHSEELAQNGYEVLKGNRLKNLKLSISESDVPETDFGNITMAPQLGIFDFRAFLNLAMLITESERARLLRQMILDIVIDTINQRTGGGTKYINQRDEDFIFAYFQEENYRKDFTGALSHFVAMGNFKYPLYTDKIYVSIFREKAQEYRKVLRLHKEDKVRDTFYAEILDLVASYEYGFAKVIEEAFKKKGRKLTSWEVDELFKAFETQPLWKPLVERARNKMASRDLAFRDALHLQLKEYITPLQAEEFERFIGEKSKELVERLEEARDVFEKSSLPSSMTRWMMNRSS